MSFDNGNINVTTQLPIQTYQTIYYCNKRYLPYIKVSIKHLIEFQFSKNQNYSSTYLSIMLSKYIYMVFLMTLTLYIFCASTAGLYNLTFFLIKFLE